MWEDGYSIIMNLTGLGCEDNRRMELAQGALVLAMLVTQHLS